METWRFILERLERGGKVALLYVRESRGSSPGRRGFKMAVTTDGEMSGSIGGGIMEQQLVEEAKQLLKSNPSHPILKRQVHRSDAGAEGSGLICSGEQTVLCCPLGPEDRPALEAIVRGRPGLLTLGPGGLRFPDQPGASIEEPWVELTLGERDTICIIGGGHVGLALSRVMAPLGFRVEIFDDRSGLKTIEENTSADRKHIGPWTSLGERIPEGNQVYVAVVTFGFEVDRTVLKQLLERDFGYLGLMGSKAKLKRLFEVLRAEGVDEGALARVRAPIGLPIHSHTPEEIAISIAAEIIQVKHSGIASASVPSKLKGD